MKTTSIILDRHQAVQGPAGPSAQRIPCCFPERPDSEQPERVAIRILPPPHPATLCRLVLPDPPERKEQS
jgi:hypothetical protein